MCGLCHAHKAKPHGCCKCVMGALRATRTQRAMRPALLQHLGMSLGVQTRESLDGAKIFAFLGHFSRKRVILAAADLMCCFRFFKI